LIIKFLKKRGSYIANYARKGTWQQTIGNRVKTLNVITGKFRNKKRGKVFRISYAIANRGFANGKR